VLDNIPAGILIDELNILDNPILLEEKLEYYEKLRETANQCSAKDYQAVKMINKHNIITNGYQEFVYNEIKTMSSVNHPMILSLNSVAQDEHMIYMFIEYCKNGSLSIQLNKHNSLPRKCAEFLTA
jgi:serine/threonine protein kinase